jgi:tetratricopeptide (TPR) repeat protein
MLSYVLFFRRNGNGGMKSLEAISLLIFMVIFLTADVTYAQSSAEESYNKGVEYAVQGKFPKAKEEFEKALMVDPLCEPANFYLKVIKDINDKKIKRESAVHFFKGVSNTTKGQYDQAISDYTRAIEINPKFAEAYNERGVVYDDKDQFDLAISDYTKAIEINPKFAVAYNNRGGVYDGIGQYDQAISDYTKAIEINPKLAEVYNNRAFAYYTKNQYNQAIRDYIKAIEISPKFALAYNNLGLAYYEKGQYDQAMRKYTKAIEINPKFALAYNNRGFLYFVKLGNKSKGCADFKKACELGECGNYNLAKQKGYCY